MALTIALLGRLAIDVDGVAADVAKLGTLGRVALAYLVLERHRPVSRDELADVLWGEDLPATWESALRGVIARLRATLTAAGLPASEMVSSRFGCYHVELPDGAVVDVEAAEAALSAAERDLASAPTRALAAAAHAADLAAKGFLPGAGGQWAERRQADLTATHVRALELLSQAASETGDHAAAVTAAEHAVALAPLREPAHQRLMAAHARAGDAAAGLQAYQRLRDVLAEELGVSPSPETEAVYLALLGDEPATTAATAARAGNLPADRTSFVGRAAQIEELRGLLASTRLLTLTGPGGVGKSRLAVRLGAEVTGDHPDGVWMVELAGITDPALVPRQVLTVLGVPEVTGLSPTTALARHLAERRLLLILDNCEHLVAASAALSDALLRAGCDLRIVATSREPLGVAGETTWAVPPLATPDPAGGESDLGALLAYESALLFRDRALAAAPDLDLTAAAADVALICSRVDGIPLAIELAASRARTISIAAIAERLDDRLRLLVGGPRTAPGRHQTLRATVDWSFDALTADEQTLFARLAVFAGGFAIEAAEVVGAEPGVDVADVLGALVDKSLVTAARRRAGVRYRVLEVLRQYGAERLAAIPGHEPEIRGRHLQWAVELAESAEPGLEGAEQVDCLHTLDAEHDNLRAALDWAAANGAVEPGLRLAAALIRFWEIRGHLSEGRSRLEAFSAHADGPPALRAKALNAAAVLAQRQGDSAAARTHYQESLVIRRALGDALGAATALHGLANLAVGDDDLVTARSLFEENLAMAREAGRPRMEAASLMNLGVVAHSSFMRGHRPIEEAGAEAQDYYRQSLECYRQAGDRYGMALALENLGALERLFTGNVEASRVLHEQSMAIRRDLGDKLGIAGSARYLAALALRTGQIGTARQLNEERLVLERELGNTAAVAEVLADLGEIALGEGNEDEARNRLEESLALAEDRVDRSWTTRMLTALGEVARRQGDTERARSALARAAAMSKDIENPHAEAWVLATRARLSLTEDDAGAALRDGRRALDLAEEYEMPGVEAAVLDALAAVAMAVDADAGRVVRLHAAAEAIRGGPPRPPDPERDQALAVARAGLGDDAFRSAWDEGLALSPDERRALARERAAR